MKKIFKILFILTALSMSAYAATYKINNSGKVVSPSGTVQTNTNLYNNYSATNYVSNNIVNQNAVGTIDIVMDYSGSMEPWINVAERTMARILSQIPLSTKVGFRAFGQYYNERPSLAEVKNVIKSKNGQYKVQTGYSSPGCKYIGSTTGGCSATVQVAPVLPNNTKAIITGMKNTNIGGSTPLVFGLYNAVNKDFGSMSRSIPKKIVLITDGGETCGGNACAFAKELMQTRSDIHIDVVLVSAESTELICLAKTTGGKFYTINNLSQFQQTLIESLNSAPQEIEDDDDNKQKYEFIKTNSD